jgi:GH24 family phage-related lysozyme (muramidase)
MNAVLSPQGADFIIAWEGFIDHCYDDSQGNCTIGVGHLVHMGKTTDADKTHWGTINRQRAVELMQQDAHKNGLDALNQSIHVDLTQPQVDALVCLAFNTGPGSLAPGHAIATAVNSKPSKFNPIAMRNWRQRVTDAFMQWAHPNELTRRRQSEACLFKTGKYTKATGNPFANA